MDTRTAADRSILSERMTTGAPRKHRRAPSLAMTYVAVGGLVAVGAAAGLFGRLGPVIWFVLGLATLVALIGSVWVRRPSHVWPWVVIALAFALFVGAAVARAQLQDLGNLSGERFLLMDLVSLLGYALLGVGLFGFAITSERGLRQSSSILLDGLIAAFSLAAVAWVFAIQPVLIQHDVPLLVKLVLIAYPSMSLFLVVVTMRLAFSPGQELVPAYWFLLAGMALMFVGDALYMFADLSLIETPTGLLDLPYALAFLCAGAAALHPSMRALTEPCRLSRVTESKTRIAVVAVALLIPAVLMLAERGTTPSDRLGLFVLLLALGVVTVLRIIEALHTAARSETRLAFQATHDSLTGLPNRRLMEQHLSKLLERDPPDETHVALLFLDLDRFKLVNDTLGHTHGDELLVQVAERLRANVKSTDMVTRIGGDEFMIVLGQVVSVSQALDLANRLRVCLREPFVMNDMDFHLSASIGLAFASGDDRRATSEALVRDADTAMYQAKDAGRDAVAVFDKSMRQRLSERVALEHDLRTAVSQGQLHVVYQPIVRLPSGRPMGMEALVRWAHPTYGVISPSKFIPLAEESGLINEIGGWVLQEAVGQLAVWHRRHPSMRGMYVSVNVSGAQLRDDELVDRVADVLALHDLDGSKLALELTESVLMDDPEEAAATLEQLRSLGVIIAIDDFGSEYSSLAYLKRFPATMLKIDKSFVNSLSQPDSSDATLIATVVAMGRALDITTVAEGVETSMQATRLLELGCDQVQGFLYSRPVRADRLPEVVSSLRTQRLHVVPAAVSDRPQPLAVAPSGTDSD
jgi:diguanylate cyclase (GGDEF)-like protein